ncbi:MAG: metallophosphoesterase family protein [Clostridiales bacterium]|nr:metallophosphoesterase family protein [Clostridiales bacterium]MDY3747645.1 metallophosphoesterase family protein [Lachnospiraceae bacterium]
MKIMVLSDTESKSLWDYFEKSKLEGIDLILSCGDLSPQYLSFLVTFTKVPVLYVHGNHDGCYDNTPPEGCIDIEDQIFVYRGVRILGLGGSMRYNSGSYQYTQSEMNKRIRKLWFKLKRYKGFDILLAHSPAFRVNDGEDLPHTGFKGFLSLMDKYTPAYFVHGHVHMSYGRQHVRVSNYKDTKIVNAYEQYIIEIEDKEPSAAGGRFKRGRL